MMRPFTSLYGVDHYAFSFLRGIQAGIVHRVVDVGLGLGAGLRLQVFHKHVLGLGRGHPGYGLELLVDLGGKAVAFFLLALQILHLGAHLTAGAVDFVLLAAEFAGLLTKLRLLVVHGVFTLLQLLVLIADIVFVFAL